MRKLKSSKKIKSKAKFKITACYIVKNEEKNLPRSIESLKNQIDELVVVDTGSTDKTIEIAKSYGAKVIETPWQNDFSTPRNLAIENASGDWIIFLDADEFFITPNKVRSTIEKHSDVEEIFVMRIDIDEDNGNTELNRDYYLRIFRNVDYLRYRGLIHENVENLNGNATSRAFDQKDLMIYHTGYSAKTADDKLHRNLAIIELEEQKYGAKDQHNIALADCYFALQDYEKVIHYANKALTAKLRPITGLGSLYHKLLLAMRKLNYPVDDILQTLDDAVKDVPDSPHFYAEKGLILYVLKRYDDAYENLTKSINKWHEMTNRNNDIYFKYLAEEVFVRLTELEAMTGNFTAAKKNLNEAIKLAPDNKLYKNKYAELQKIEQSYKNVQ